MKNNRKIIVDMFQKLIFFILVNLYLTFKVGVVVDVFTCLLTRGDLDLSKFFDRARALKHAVTSFVKFVWYGDLDFFHRSEIFTYLTSDENNAKASTSGWFKVLDWFWKTRKKEERKIATASIFGQLIYQWTHTENYILSQILWL